MLARGNALLSEIQVCPGWCQYENQPDRSVREDPVQIAYHRELIFPRESFAPRLGRAPAGHDFRPIRQVPQSQDMLLHGHPKAEQSDPLHQV